MHLPRCDNFTTEKKRELLSVFNNTRDTVVSPIFKLMLYCCI